MPKTGKCHGFSVPSGYPKVVRVRHRGSDAWKGELVRVVFDDELSRTCRGKHGEAVEVDDEDEVTLVCN